MALRTTVELDGRQVRIELPAGAPASAAHELVLWTGQHLLDLLRRCADELLDDLNTGWLRPGQSPVGREQFVLQLELAEITVYDDGAHEWGFDDRGLFWGHRVLVHGDRDRRVTEVELVD